MSLIRTGRRECRFGGKDNEFSLHTPSLLAPMWCHASSYLGSSCHLIQSSAISCQVPCLSFPASFPVFGLFSFNSSVLKKEPLHWNMYTIMYETNCQSRFNARYWMLGAGALGLPRGMVWGGRREEGSGWGTHVYLWRIHFNIWQNLYNIVKFKKKKKKKKQKKKKPLIYWRH